MIIDAHCHIWPDAVAPRALGGAPADLERFGDGTEVSLRSVMAADGIDRAVCLGVAPRAKYVEATNRFLAGLDRDLFIGFGSIHPDLDVESNLRSLEEGRLRGVKVHPLFQGYALDDRRLWEILEAMGDRYLVTIHVGHGGPGSERCTPRMLRELARTLPDLPIIACHLGGYHLLEEAETLVAGLPNVFLDTSWPPSLATVPRDAVHRIIQRHGADRVVFASDWPMSSPGAEVGALAAVGLSDSELQAILGENLQGLLDAHAPDASW